MSERKQHPDEVTLGEFLYGIADIVRWIKSNFLGLALFSIIGAALLGLYAFTRPTVYKARLTFMLSDDNSSQMAGLGGVLGQLGLPISTGRYNIDKLLEIAKQRRIVSSALFRKVEIDGKTDLLANHFIEAYELDQQWASFDAAFDGYRLSSSDSTLESSTARYAIKQLHHLLVGSTSNRSNAIVQTEYGNPDYIMAMDATSINHDLSIATSTILYEELEEFYVTSAAESYQDTYNLIREKRDSIATSLESKQIEIAQLKDLNVNTFENKNTVRLSKLQTEVMGLGVALQEVERNLGIAEYALKTSTPLIQLIDDPIGPLSPSKPSLIKYALLGFVMGVIGYVIFYLTRVVIRMV